MARRKCRDIEARTLLRKFTEKYSLILKASVNLVANAVVEVPKHGGSVPLCSIFAASSNIVSMPIKVTWSEGAAGASRKSFIYFMALNLINEYRYRSINN